MGKKQRKGKKYSKGFDHKSSKSDKDPITGLYAMANGTKIHPDKIYNQDSNFPGKQLLGDNFETEYELGEEAMIWTITRRDTERDQVSYQRIALLGDFEYNQEGRFLGGKVREVGEWSYGTNLNGEYRFEWGSVDYNYSGPISMSPNLMLIDSTLKSLQDRQCDYAASNSDGVYYGDRSCMQSYPSSIYFQDNWWENPFATNLI